MLDGSDAIADWPILNALLKHVERRLMVSVHHGGGVGIGRSIHAGMVVVGRRTAEAARKLERVLTNDPGTGVMRPRGRGVPARIDVAAERGVHIPMAKANAQVNGFRDLARRPGVARHRAENVLIEVEGGRIESDRRGQSPGGATTLRAGRSLLRERPQATRSSTCCAAPPSQEAAISGSGASRLPRRRRLDAAAIWNTRPGFREMASCRNNRGRESIPTRLGNGLRQAVALAAAQEGIRLTLI